MVLSRARSASGRNDARSRRPGRRDDRRPQVRLGVAAMMPGHEDREDRLELAHAGLVALAAMMPGHEDREDASSPRRPGGSTTGRNDARSRRPGRPSPPTEPALVMHPAAMMPGHEDREDAWLDNAASSLSEPQ